MPPNKPSTCSSFYHKAAGTPRPMPEIETNNFKWLPQKTRGMVKPSGRPAQGNNFTCNLFMALSPIRSEDSYHFPLSEAWLLQPPTRETLAGAIYEQVLRGERAWLLLDWRAGAEPDPSLQSAFKLLISSVLLTRDPMVLHVIAGPPLAPLIQTLMHSDSAIDPDEDPAPGRIWSPLQAEAYSQFQQAPGLWFSSWQTSRSLWEQAHPNANNIPELEPILRLRKLKNSAEKISTENKKSTQRQNFLNGLRMFTGRRKT